MDSCERPSLSFSSAARSGELHLLVAVIGALDELLIAGERGLVLSFLGERAGDLFLHAEVVGKLLLQPVPHGECFGVAMGPLMHAPQRLVDLQQVGPLRLALDGALECRGSVIRTTDEHIGLTEIERSERFFRQLLLGFGEGGDRFGIAAALELEHAEDHPGDAVLGVRRRAVAVGLGELLDLPAPRRSGRRRDRARRRTAAWIPAPR